MAIPQFETDPGTLLTPRQAEALLWTAFGKTTEEVGIILGVAASTAKTHLDMVAAKLHATNRAQMVANAFALGHLRTATKTMSTTALLLLTVGFINGTAATAEPPERVFRTTRVRQSTRAGRRNNLHPSLWDCDYV